MSRMPYDSPIHAAAEHGSVVLDGPDGLAIALTPDAARVSAKAIRAAAEIADRDPDAEMP